MINLTKEQLQEVDSLILKKYGQENYNAWKEGRLLIDDTEISKIYGYKVVYKIPVGAKSLDKDKAIKELKKLYNSKEALEKDSTTEDYFIPVKKYTLFHILKTKLKEFLKRQLFKK